MPFLLCHGIVPFREFFRSRRFGACTLMSRVRLTSPGPYALVDLVFLAPEQ